MSDQGNYLKEDFVWDDDPRLKRESAIAFLSGGSMGVWEYDLTGSLPLGLLVRSGHSIRFLPVKKRRKPLELKAGQRWGYRSGCIYRIVTQTGPCFWGLLNEKTSFVSGGHTSIWSTLGIDPGDDPRDYGWELVEE